MLYYVLKTIAITGLVLAIVGGGIAGLAFIEVLPVAAMHIGSILGGIGLLPLPLEYFVIY